MVGRIGGVILVEARDGCHSDLSTLLYIQNDETVSEIGKRRSSGRMWREGKMKREEKNKFCRFRGVSVSAVIDVGGVRGEM